MQTGIPRPSNARLAAFLATLLACGDPKSSSTGGPDRRAGTDQPDDSTCGSSPAIFVLR